MSSVRPSANAARSGFPPTHLKGSTASQKPSSDRDAPESCCDAPESPLREAEESFSLKPRSVPGFTAREPDGVTAELFCVEGVVCCNGIGCEECRARSRNSLLTSRAVCIRWRGSFSRHRRVMRTRSLGRSARISPIDAGVSRRIAEESSAKDDPSNGRRPVDISCSITPSEKISVR